MKKFIKVIVVIMALTLVVSTLSACGAEKAEVILVELDGDAYDFDDSNGISVHDPSLFKAEDGTYYIYGTHIVSAKSTDLINWQTISSGVYDNNATLVLEGSTLRETLAEPLSWCDGYLYQSSDDAELQTNVWASCVIYNEAMGKYCYYACSSVWGTATSVIWFATSDDPEGTFEYEASIVYSGFNKLTKLGFKKYSSHYYFTNIGDLIENGTFTKSEVEDSDWFDEDGNYNCAYGAYPNCIDPTVFYDEDGNLWMVYGSYSGGIYLIPLIEETGMPDYDYMRETDGYDIYFGKQITKTNEETDGTGEGPYIVYDSETGYYYLYLTYGGLDALDGYNIREYRSESVEGPYVDAEGNEALEMSNTGLKINGNYQFSFTETAKLSGGHSSCFIDDDGKIYQAYHQRYSDGVGSTFYDEIHQMLRTENGWHTMLPLEYNGETATAVKIEDVVGEYEFILFSDSTTDLDDDLTWDDVSEIIEPTLTAKIKSDGTIVVTDEDGENVTGEITLKDDSYQFTLQYDGETYYGAFCLGTTDAGDEVMTFSAVGENNRTIWAVGE